MELDLHYSQLLAESSVIEYVSADQNTSQVSSSNLLMLGIFNRIVMLIFHEDQVKYRVVLIKSKRTAKKFRDLVP